MKSLLRSAGMILLAAMPMLAACGQKEDPVKETPYIRAAEKEIAVTAEAGEKSIAIEQNQGFTLAVTAGSEWLSAKASADNNSVTLSWTANEGAERAGEVTLTQESAMWKFTVTQAEAPDTDPDLTVAYTLQGKMEAMNMVVYAFAEDAFKNVPEGRIVVFKFKNQSGQVRLMDGNNEAKLYRNITPDNTVAVQWDGLAADLAVGGRLMIIGEGALENELLGVYVTKAAQIEYTFQGKMEEMGLVIYAIPEGAFKDVAYGDIVVLKFKSIGLVNGEEVTPNQIRLLDANNEALLYREITPDNTVAFNWSKDEIEGKVVDMASVSRIMIIGAGALDNEITGISYVHIAQ